jgi:hypothetical protein
MLVVLEEFENARLVRSFRLVSVQGIDPTRGRAQHGRIDK